MDNARPILLVGSIGLPDAKTTFQSLAQSLGNLASRYPDGEPGLRSSWISWQKSVIADNAQFKIGRSQEIEFGGLKRSKDWYKLADDIKPEDVVFDELGYANEAISSYEIFQQLRDQREIPQGTKFQISLPTPLAFVTSHLVLDIQAALEPIYEAAMQREIDKILTTIPADQLAVQWDVCHEILIAEDAMEAYYEDRFGYAIDHLTRLAAYLPAETELGFHLCYGDPGHKHVVEPASLKLCVNIANALQQGVDRRIDWIHMPIPRDRNDEAYFEPLAHLSLADECEIYLGLIHLTDGKDGAEKRINVASKFVSNFGIATECGFGRRPTETIRTLLNLHADISSL